MIWTWYILLFIPIAWFLQNCIHEASHLFFAWMDEGRKPTGFYPYPHKHRGIFYFARYTTGPATRTTISKFKHIAPFISGISLFLVCLGCVFGMPAPTKIYFLLFGATNLIDALFFWYTYLWGSKYSDGQKFKKN